MGKKILLYGGKKAEYLVTFEPGKKIQTHLGVLTLPETLEYGMRLETHIGKSFYILFPTTRELSMRVRRTTTIIYPKDAGYMIIETGIGAGSKVLETGTGSGALTIILATIVGKEGKVHTFERREEFFNNAIKNVKDAGLDDRVEFHHRDPVEEGFGIEPVDAAFIDVPEPWTLVKPVYEVLKPGHVWVSLSPTIEQVQKTYEVLKETGFIRLKCVEILEREMLIRPGKTRPKERMISHTGYLTFAWKVKKEVQV